MKSICFYFQVHQPFRLKRYRFFDIGTDSYYYDDFTNRTIVRKIANKCYLPANQMLLDLVNQNGGRFRVAFSISGMALEQFEQFAPEVIESFKRLAQTGCVEFLAETYSHSLVSLKNKELFMEQVQKHADRIESLFGKRPTAFRNTELVYSDGIGEMAAEMGFNVVLAEGAKHILGWKSPDYVYSHSYIPKLKLLLRNYKLSDDIAFRFSNRGWSEHPLTAEKFTTWVQQLDAKEEIVNLFMDYETFGEHQPADSGIFEFMKALPTVMLGRGDFQFLTPSEIAAKHKPVGHFNVNHPISWADEERDLTAWLGNEMQDDAFDKLYALHHKVAQVKDQYILRDWNYLQTSDHFYYMCTKFFSDGAVHQYFNPYSSPYDAFINYMNVLSDFSNRVDAAVEELERNKKTSIEIDPDADLETEISKYENLLKQLKAKAEKKRGPKAIEKTKPEAKAIELTKKQPKALPAAPIPLAMDKKAKTESPAKTDKKSDKKTDKKADKKDDKKAKKGKK